MARGSRYTPTQYVNGSTPALNQTHLNRHEDATADATNRLADIEQSGADEKAQRLRPVPAGHIDVQQLVLDNRQGITSGQPYRDPTPQEAGAAVAGVLALLRGEQVDLTGLGITVTSGWCSQAAKAVTIVQAERGTERCWGLWVLPVEAPVHSVIEAPHPVADADSDVIAYRLWAAAPDGVALAVGGSHRTDATRENPRDVAHNTSSLWMIITSALITDGVTQFQQHGYADSSAPGTDLVVSQGSAAESRALRAVAELVGRAGIRVARGWDDSGTVLLGRNNPLGQAARTTGGVFAHMEASRTLRDTMVDQYVAAVIASGFFTPSVELLMGTDAPGAVGSANTRGESRTAARSDHTHRLTQNDPVNGQWVGRSQGGWRALDLPAAGLTAAEVAGLRALLR